MCQGLSEQEQIDCLCPSPLNYALRALASPADDNYATEIDIKQVDKPIYRLRIFARTQIDSTADFSVAPFGGNHSTSVVVHMAYDPFSLILQSTAPESEYKIAVHTSEGLRLKCINQEN
jgi:hypothetical protein